MIRKNACHNFHAQVMSQFMCGTYLSQNLRLSVKKYLFCKIPQSKMSHALACLEQIQIQMCQEIAVLPEVEKKK